MMDDIYITGIGMITVVGNDCGEVWASLNEDCRGRGESQELPFTVPLPSARVRRINRYSKLAVAGALYAQKDGDIIIDGNSAFRYGTIFTTGYGAMVSNVQFCESVAEDDPDICSPTLFAGTVPNSCVGQVCMNLSLKGPSTILIGGNILTYSKLLLQTGKADIIFAGSVEEYSEELFGSLKTNPVSADMDIRESTMVFTLERAAQDKKEAYCVIENSAAGALDAYPLVKKFDACKSKDIIAQTIKTCIADNGSVIDTIVSSSNGSWFDEVENEAIKESVVGMSNIAIIPSIKKYFGETMGSSFNVNIMVAALCLKNNTIPVSLVSEKYKGHPFAPRKILVTGYDTIGNYHCTILAKK